MNIMQRIRSVRQRPLSYIESLFKEKEAEIPVENDPVGEFLESKKKGIDLAEDGTAEATPVAKTSSQAVSQAVETSNKNVAAADKVETVTQAVGSQMGGSIQSETKVEAPVGAPTGSEKVETSKDEDEANAVLSEARLEARVLEPVGQKVEAANMPPVNSPQEEEKIESVLEVFRSEELAIEATSALSKELGDMSVYSLLEETKQIAQIAKKVKKASQES